MTSRLGQAASDNERFTESDIGNAPSNELVCSMKFRRNEARLCGHSAHPTSKDTTE